MRHLRTIAAFAAGTTLAIGVGAGSPASAGGADDPVGTLNEIVADAPRMLDEAANDPCVKVKYYFFEVGGEGHQLVCALPIHD